MPPLSGHQLIEWVDERRQKFRVRPDIPGGPELIQVLQTESFREEGGVFLARGRDDKVDALAAEVAEKLDATRRMATAAPRLDIMMNQTADEVIIIGGKLPNAFFALQSPARTDGAANDKVKDLKAFQTKIGYDLDKTEKPKLSEMGQEVARKIGDTVDGFWSQLVHRYLDPGDLVCLWVPDYLAGLPWHLLPVKDDATHWCWGLRYGVSVQPLVTEGDIMSQRCSSVMREPTQDGGLLLVVDEDGLGVAEDLAVSLGGAHVRPSTPRGAPDLVAALAEQGVTSLHYHGHATSRGLQMSEGMPTGMTLRENLKSLNGKLDLAFLNACQTAIQASGQSAVDTLAAVFLTCARAVVGTMWMIDATGPEAEDYREFIKGFYEALARGQNTGTAMLHARQRSHESARSPHIWAAYSLLGQCDLEISSVTQLTAESRSRRMV